MTKFVLFNGQFVEMKFTIIYDPVIILPIDDSLTIILFINFVVNIVQFCNFVLVFATL